MLFFLLFQMREHHKVLKRVADVMTSWDDNTTLGIWLGYDPDHIERLRSEGSTVTGAALKILRWFYTQSTDSDETKWSTVIETLGELKRHATIQRLGLHQLKEEARVQDNAQDTASHGLPQPTGNILG